METKIMNYVISIEELSIINEGIIKIGHFTLYY
jgi:hypothetical protein